VGDGCGLFADAFAFFAANFLTDVANAFAFVRLRWVEPADLGGELTDELFIDAFDLDFGIFHDRDLETGWDGVKEWVGATESKIEIRTLDGGTQADAVDFKIFDEALGDSDDHVLDEATNRAVKGTVLA